MDYYKLFKISKWADRIHRRMEQRVFKTAKKITIASPHWKRDLESIGAKNVDVIYWGYDESDFELLKPSSKSKFTIVHAGIFGLDRLPENLFKVLKELCEDSEDFNNDLSLDLYGMVDFSIKESLTKYGLNKNTNYNGTIPRSTILQKLIDADLLLLPLNKSDNILGRIPGKLFEYLRSFVPIICLGPKQSDVSKIITEINAGRVFDYEEIGILKDFVKKKYVNYTSKNSNSISVSDISKYSVRNQTKKISHLLNEIS